MLGAAGPRAPLGGPDIMNQVEQTQMSLHWVPLPYIDYDSGRRLGESHVLYFQNKGGHEFALSLVKQRGRDAINDLVGRDTPAPLGNASAKLSIRLHFEGTIQYTRQIMARRSTAHAEPISMGNLAYKIALEMEAFMVCERDGRKGPTPSIPRT
ncbi:hypothetical protein BD309DRAFT_987626 [Dichomitus squalens]|uniref:Uncharacterized protein n=1 Tax=Dichomitus squalens TaxID=114155 RepID=A0A4Q9MY51_9APHY|nr:hypothetical protein BD311DRAFT_775398 [Dichomitus squalens]TBU47947.1 hypothetical protein BD309DRAFT_987626 [Dichomitus squalens]